ncbi:MAG TPA: efflux RND transporter periplasmic adaptor subunit [Thermoanaerobaculia bacterium]|nr:efflux RND transporter periplasmic adaptor subunit [Thermoanaerobaculia bacterium]
MNDFSHDSNGSTDLRRPRRWLSNLGWLVGGALLAVLLVADPLGLHPVDSWLHRVVGRWHGAPDLEPGPSPAEAQQLWTCGMHPEVIQDHPGQCPICGMDLVPIEAGTGPVEGDRKILFYRNPMDPTITSPVPARDEMGMDYVPVYSDEVGEAASQGATVTIDPGVVQNMNVQTAEVERRDLARKIRTVGYLDYDQEKMVSVTTKYAGFVEKVYVNYIGEPVRRGQPLYEVYAPELVQTQRELLAALGFARRLEGTSEEARGRAEALVDAARSRLAFWDITAGQIEALEESGEPRRTLTVVAPAGGVVMMRMAGLEGMAIRPGMELFHIADLSTLWLSVEVFEDQLAWLREESEAEISLSYFPGEMFRGRIRFVEPQVNEKTRTVGLRVEVPNRDGRLRAGMYATVQFAPVMVENAVVVPSQAVLRTGERDLVVVALGEGRFAPREVRLGVEGDHFQQVLDGVEPGERVVTSAQFLLDSESNLREAIQKLIASRRDESANAPTSDAHAGH